MVNIGSLPEQATIVKLQGQLKEKAALLDDWDKRKKLADIRNQLAVRYGKCVDDVKLPTQMAETLKELKALRTMQK